jgi:hypothetical protein
VSAEAVIETPPEQTRGAMEETLRREIPAGLIEFEQAPAGWLTKTGTPREKPWRAYHWTPTEGDRQRLPSTTTLLDAICPKAGLPPWSEARGVEGAVEGVRLGLIDHETTPERGVGIVRAHKLGAEAAKRKAAERGLNVHALLEAYMLTGAAPKLGEHPKHHRGYIQGLTRWLIAENPEPVAVEQLVVHPEDGYAGRLDLRARIDGQLVTVDLKTQERGGIYATAHWQVAMYERAARWCGDEPADRKMVVVVAANGEFRQMDAEWDEERLNAALAYYRASRPVESACESANRIEREARKAVSA